MKTEDRNTLIETVDILRALGGNNGFSNLHPKYKKLLLGYAKKIDDIVKNDIQFGKSMEQVDFDGEIVYEDQEVTNVDN